MKILIADDSQVSRTVLMKRLSTLGYEMVIAEDGLQALEVLSSDDPPEIAVLDWMMPGMEGIDVCRRVRESGSDRYTYIVIVTMKEKAEEIAEGLAAGADDFIVKPFQPIELDARIRVGERLVRYAERLRRANADLAQIARTDELTSMYNRGAILERLEEEHSRHRREGRALSVLMVDVDSFKPCNDAHGHAAGDAVIRMVGDALQGACRIYDTVGRYGGDEFLMLLPAAEADNALTVAERVRERVEAGAVTVGGVRISMTVSIGAATLAPGDEWPAMQVVRAADAALYRAKHSGRNTICAATGEEYEQARHAPAAG